MKPSRLFMRSQRGVAAIELALILPVLLTLLAFPLLFGRIFWHYTVAQKAAHDAATYLSTVPLIEMKSTTRTAYAVAVTQDILNAELSGLNPGPNAPATTILCGAVSCNGFSVPTTVRVEVQISMIDTIFGDITWRITGDSGLLLTADVTMPYVGN